jgi:hypothetical protein
MLRRKKISSVRSAGTKNIQKESHVTQIPLGSKRKKKNAEEAHLEKLVLGGDRDVIQTLQEASEKVNAVE